MRRKRGFTIVEAVVAMAIITIVSLSAIAIISSSGKATKSALKKQKAENFLSDIITCFRADSLDFLEIDGTATEAKDYQVPDTDYIATVTIEGNKISVEIRGGDKLITSGSFTKGVRVNEAS